MKVLAITSLALLVVFSSMGVYYKSSQRGSAESYVDGIEGLAREHIRRGLKVLRTEYATTTWKENVDAAKKMNPVCTLKPSTEEEKAPVPVVLMSLGRSGSTAIWQIMGDLTGQSTHAAELAGSSEGKSKTFFSRMPLDNGGNWALEHLCRQQESHPNAGMVGFKWKPFGSGSFSEQSIDTLKMFAASHDPPIKVVRSRRNLLDRTLSYYKHHAAEIFLPAHCKLTNSKCIEAHNNAEMDLMVPVDELLETLYQDSADEDRVDQLLDDFGVEHIDVSYDKLFHAEDIAPEWMRIFKFLGVGPAEGLTSELVRSVMITAATSHASHEGTLKNFAEIRDALKNTPFENLLH